MKPKKVTENTDNSRVYKIAYNSLINSCPICSPNKGCNRNWGRYHNYSWKSHRDNQWRE